MKVSIFLPTFNKGKFALDAIKSVMDQTYQDWELWILENSLDDDRSGRTDKFYTRRIVKAEVDRLNDQRILFNQIELGSLRDFYYVAARLLNIFFPVANGEFIIFLADDDLLKPNCLETCVTHMQSNPDQKVCYFGMDKIGVTEPGDTVGTTFPMPRGWNTNEIRRKGSLDMYMDSGQIFFYKSCLDRLQWPYFEEDIFGGIGSKARHSDGLFCEALAEHFDFYPIGQTLATHRMTPISYWQKFINGLPAF